MRGEAGHPVRLRFAKEGKVRFVSHRDVARAFERALRVAGLPVAFTAGFAPRPKVSFGLALGVGHESRAEYLDVELREPAGPAELPGLLTAGLPPGLAVTGAAALAPRAPALQESVTAVAYTLRLADVDAAAIVDAAAAAGDATTLVVASARKGRPVTVDVAPSLRSLTVDADGVDVELSTRPRAARPAEVLTALRTLLGTEPGEGEDRVLRTHQWIERDGARREPLAADLAPSAPSGADARALEACA
ncbi:MAG TPA: TIGR03936 family radical SAM-associated protein [Acidimicrobiia bacterium]|nr:TIGR03936 family radical SAM-associated protein [Acidimicrobiia bacterium]